MTTDSTDIEGLVVNQQEAYELACIKRKDSNLARCYLEQRAAISSLTAKLGEREAALAEIGIYANNSDDFSDLAVKYIRLVIAALRAESAEAKLADHSKLTNVAGQDPAELIHMTAENLLLRALLLRYRRETPTAHQPFMIAHEVDAILNNGGPVRRTAK